MTFQTQLSSLSHTLATLPGVACSFHKVLLPFTLCFGTGNAFYLECPKSPFFFLSLSLKFSPPPVKIFRDPSSLQQGLMCFLKPRFLTACHHPGNRTVGSLRAVNQNAKRRGKGSKGLKLVGITNSRLLFSHLWK